MGPTKVGSAEIVAIPLRLVYQIAHNSRIGEAMRSAHAHDRKGKPGNRGEGEGKREAEGSGEEKGMEKLPFCSRLLNSHSSLYLIRANRQKERQQPANQGQK